MFARRLCAKQASVPNCNYSQPGNPCVEDGDFPAAWGDQPDLEDLKKEGMEPKPECLQCFHCIVQQEAEYDNPCRETCKASN
jgi:hypothetical protein